LLKRSQKPSGAPELTLRAIFFGRVVQISTHAAPADTIPAWFSHVCNSERYKQEVELGRRHDLAHTVIQYLGDWLAHGVKRHIEDQERRNEYLRFHLGETTLKVPRQSIWFIDSSTSLAIVAKSAIETDSASQQVSRRAMRKLFRFDVFGHRFIGLAPVLAQASDHLCILQGAKVPFIVRGNGELGGYTLVGEALAPTSCTEK
jgi:hypothetical protein